MATWSPLTVENVINQIADRRMVLPVIQRRLVWDAEQMEKLFDTLMRQDSFGGIMVIEEEKGESPLFECRRFTDDGENVSSLPRTTPWDQATQVVIDGQQRLQTFYIGLRGNFRGRQLFINLGTDAEHLDFEFRFPADPSKLPPTNQDEDGANRPNLWFPVVSLYDRITSVRRAKQAAQKIIAEKGVEDATLKSRIEENVEAFFLAVFSDLTVGVSKVQIIPDHGVKRNKRRIVELFRRLNDGGTRLSCFDLMASVLKSADWRMEGFLDEMLKKYGELSIGQDELIKLIFILQDKWAKEVSDVEDTDAEFAITNRERIGAALDAMSQFLRLAGLYEWFRLPGRSVIPLYCIAYHYFHQSEDPQTIQGLLNKFDVKSRDFAAIKQWIVFSILCGVFRSRGAGWVAYRTGLHALCGELRQHKGQTFPCEALFSIYRARLHFFTNEISAETLSRLDWSFVFYLIYDGKRVVRDQDYDHIHPKSLLTLAGANQDHVEGMANFQLIDAPTNRGVKNASELQVWIEGHVEERQVYLALHLIPPDQELWRTPEFERFYEARQLLLIAKLQTAAAI